jgi:hypothetical protein
VGVGKGIAAGDRARTARADASLSCLMNGLRVCSRETGEAAGVFKFVKIAIRRVRPTKWTEAETAAGKRIWFVEFVEKVLLLVPYSVRGGRGR